MQKVCVGKLRQEDHCKCGEEQFQQNEIYDMQTERGIEREKKKDDD